MPANKNTIVAAATAAGACALTSQLFVLPSSTSRAPRAVELAASSQAQPAVSSSSAALPLVGLTAAGAVFLAKSSRTEKVARKFFGGGGSSYKSFDPATEGGVQDPVGFWDPLGLAADKDEATFKRRRAVEIKHGRIAMYATIGYIVPEYYKFPGDLSPSQGIKFADVPTGLAAFSKVPLFGWLQIFAFAGLIETSGFFSGKATAIGLQKDSTQDGEPGNYGVGFPNFIGKVADPTARASKLNAELANGRLAMVAIIGMFFQDGLTGAAWGDWALYTASPLRSGPPVVYKDFKVSDQNGVQNPIGFWDPLNLSKPTDDVLADYNTFRRRRAVEIKHGRLAMYATIGYIVPEYYKFPGYLSPSLGLKFADVPNGLAAFSKVPAAGWLQIFAFAGIIETTGFFSGKAKPIGFMQDSTQLAEPGNYGVGFPNFFGQKFDPIEAPDARATKLNAELANGRLAMMAIIGMFFQDGLTGAAWGDWSLYTDSPLRAFESELGVQAPVGFWDPLGFTADGDVAAFRRRRSVELKHGRIAMLATMGYITPELIGKFPGQLSPSQGLSYSDIPNGLAAVAKVPTLGWLQILAYFGFVEFSGGFEDYKSGTPGDYGWKVLTSSDEAEKSKKLAAEIANGRLAMAAIIGMFFQDGLTGSAWGDWALYTASPLRAFESELGVQAPVGFWDPLGFTADGDVAAFRRRRSVELKHGRIAMLATMGYITPELIGKFPGQLSPSQGLSYSDIPNGLAAVAKVPTLGWLQILAYFGFVEFSGGFEDYKSGTPGDYGWKVLTSSDEAEKSKKLAAELANGRLAMAAIIGMFFQDGLTGSAWGDWALYTASPLRAAKDAVPPPPPFNPATQVGAGAPLGYFDPAGFSKVGDEAGFKNLQAAEIKHGRVAMMAALGGVAQHYIKFPGFESVPAGISAVTTAPGTYGFVALFLISGALELAVWTQDPSKEPGNFGDPAGLGQYNVEMRNKELNNGRFAMFAAIGIIAADLLTGKDAIQQFGL